jgi:hypothetical protein
MIGALFITSFQLGLTSWADGQGEPSKEVPPRFRFAVALIYIGVALSVIRFTVAAVWRRRYNASP